MKEKDSKIDHSHQLILYVEREDDSYGPLQTGSYMADNYLDDFFAKKNKLRRKRLDELLEGKISPLAYYKDMVDIGEGDLAIRVGVSRSKLRAHMTPKGFAAVSVLLLERYAEVFGIPVAQLFQVVLCDDEHIDMVYERSGSAQVIVTKISKKE